MGSVAWVVFAAAAAVSLAGCGSAPLVHLHSLLPAEPPLSARPATMSAATIPIPISIVLEPLVLPAQVDQPQFVIRLPDDTLAVLEQERWASPLRDELRLALLERLAYRHDVVESRGQGSSAMPPMRVSISLTRFDSALGREALLEGSWLVVAPAPRTDRWQCRWVVREAAGPGIAGLAQAHRLAWARVADALAEGLRGMTAGMPPCPSFRAPA